MRIAGNDGNIKSLTNLLLDPKIVNLIEKLSNQPILIEKIIVNDKSSLQIQLAGSLELKQLNIPIALSKKIALITNTSGNLKLNITNSQIVLNFTPLNSTIKSTGLSESSSNQTDINRLALYFKQANLITPQILQLTHHTIKSLPLINETKISETLEQAKNIRPDSSSLQFDAKNEISIKEAITYFLKTKSMDNPSTSVSFNKLTQLHSELISSLAQQVKLEKNNNLSSQILSDIKITKSELGELLRKVSSLTPKENSFSRLGALNSKINELVNALDFSIHNKKLNLEKRVINNGSFLESQLYKHQLAEQKLKTTTQSSQPKKESAIETQQIGRSESTKINQNKTARTNLPDLKLAILSVRQALDDLLKSLDSRTDKPMFLSKAFQILSKHPAFISLLANNNQLNQLQLSSQQSVNNQTISGAVTSDIKNQLHSISHSESLAKASDHEQKTFKELQSFKSASLKNIFSNESLLTNAVKTNLSQKQQDHLLTFQRQIIREMLKETAAVINKVETNQLLSMRTETPLLQQFLIDLPIYHNQKFESFELLFESKNKNEDSTIKTWTITIRFDLKPLGPMFARVSLKNDRISTHFFAKEPETTRLLQENIEHLKESLMFAGLDIDEITGQQGIVPDELLVNDELSVDVHA